MQNKKRLIFLSIILILVILGIGLTHIFKHNTNSVSLSKEERVWITNNKNQLIDIAILNKIPVINYSGNGIFFDFI